MNKKATLIYGDGIGEEVITSCVEVINSLNVKIDWEIQVAGLKAIEAYGEPLPNKVIESIKRNKYALKGPVTTPVGKGFRSVNVGLRKALNLYANVRPIKSYAGIQGRYSDIDMIIIRENTEGLYSGVEEMAGSNTAISKRIITKESSEKIARYAFDLAVKQGRKKITALHKANILKLTDGLFLDCVRNVAKDYPQIELNDLIIDAACMRLVTDPENFDILLATNLFGDIISDLCAGLIGGLGLTIGMNIGDEGAVFEAVHGSAPDIAGKNIANPTAAILAGAAMLKNMDYIEEAERIENAVTKLINDGNYLTKDLGGTLSTSEYTKQLIKII